MSEHLDERYFTWLYGQVCSVNLRNRARSYRSLMRQFHHTEFVWLIPNDDNRVEDGRDLRYEFLNSEGIDRASPEWLARGCSMLEMMIALSRRLAFEDDGEPRVWFWHLVETLELLEYTDRNYDENIAEIVDEVLERVIYRRYLPNGRGGLFPLKHPDEDQRKVELWYQASSFLLEIL